MFRREDSDPLSAPNIDPGWLATGAPASVTAPRTSCGSTVDRASTSTNSISSASTVSAVATASTATAAASHGRDQHRPPVHGAPGGSYSVVVRVTLAKGVVRPVRRLATKRAIYLAITKRAGRGRLLGHHCLIGLHGPVILSIQAHHLSDASASRWRL